MDIGLTERGMLGTSNSIIFGLYNGGDLARKGNLHVNCGIDELQRNSHDVWWIAATELNVEDAKLNKSTIRSRKSAKDWGRQDRIKAGDDSGRNVLLLHNSCVKTID